ncbi:MAG: DUF2279 domain-containing protein [Chitinophagaceae bacterium]|nr:DUF2279 domain-containing protein [Chitinophagaceae bacterium]
MKQTFTKSQAAVVSLTCTYKLLLCFSILFVTSFQLSAQDSVQLIMPPDSLKRNYSYKPVTKHQLNEPITDPNHFLLTPKQIKKRVKTIAIINVGGYSAAMVGLYAAWYKNYPQTHFHSFNDVNEWKGIDKIGHAYSAYAESKASMELWRWTGIGRKKRILLGGLSGAAYQTVIETLDGFSAQWGWSWADFASNCLGSGLIVGQELAWDEQRVQFKFSFHKKTYNDPALNKRSDKIFGSSGAERFLKDYNSQTYWLSANIKSFFPDSKMPAWLSFSIGTGVEGVFGADNNIGKDENGNIIFDGTNYKRYRQWYLAPDIDLTKIKTKKKGIKLLLQIANIVKFPMPALEYGKGKFRVHAVYF